MPDQRLVELKILSYGVANNNWRMELNPWRRRKAKKEAAAARKEVIDLIGPPMLKVVGSGPFPLPGERRRHEEAHIVSYALVKRIGR